MSRCVFFNRCKLRRNKIILQFTLKEKQFTLLKLITFWAVLKYYVFSKKWPETELTYLHTVLKHHQNCCKG